MKSKTETEKKNKHWLSLRDPGSSVDTNYKLTIIDEHEGGKVDIDWNAIRPDVFPSQMYNLTFPGRHTVGQVKRDVATVTGIPVFRQVIIQRISCGMFLHNISTIRLVGTNDYFQEWTGWPEDTNDELSLLQISLPIVHTLTVTQVDIMDIKLGLVVCANIVSKIWKTMFYSMSKHLLQAFTNTLSIYNDYLFHAHFCRTCLILENIVKIPMFDCTLYLPIYLWSIIQILFTPNINLSIGPSGCSTRWTLWLIAATNRPRRHCQQWCWDLRRRLSRWKIGVQFPWNCTTLSLRCPWADGWRWLSSGTAL